MKIVITSIVLILINGCAHKFDIMKANAVSMKHRFLPVGANTERIKDIDAKYCMTRSTDSGEDIGIMDEAVKNAEAEYNVDFILHPTFSFDGKCVFVRGEGMRIVD